MVFSMNSIKFLFVVWAFLILGGIARCKHPYSSEPCFSPRLSFSTEGTNSTEGFNVDSLDTNPARITGEPASIAGADGSFVVVAGGEFTSRPTGSIFWRDRRGKLQGFAPSAWVLRATWLRSEPTLRFPRRYDAERRTTKGYFRVETPRGQMERHRNMDRERVAPLKETSGTFNSDKWHI